MIKGIDVSSHDKEINWNKVKNSGIEFAIIRAGFGKELSQKDKFWDTNIKNASNAGILCGSYWFSYAKTPEEAEKEAEVFASVIKPYKNLLTLPLFFDWEYDSFDYAKKHGVTANKKLITDMTLAFIKKLGSMGYKAGYYTNRDYYEKMYFPDKLKEYPLWFAYYSGNPPYPCAFQQTSSESRVDGITGDVDYNICYDERFLSFQKKIYTETSMQTEGNLYLVKNKSVIRKDSHSFSEEIVEIYPSQHIKFIFDTGWGWSNVSFANYSGFMLNSDIEKNGLSKFKTGTCEGMDVNVRKAPSLNGEIIRRLNSGDKFTVISLLPSGWLHVLLNGKYAFIFYDKSYISIP